MKRKILPLNIQPECVIKSVFKDKNEFDVEITVGIAHEDYGSFTLYEYYGFIKDGVDGLEGVGDISPNNINGYSFNMFQSQYNLEDVGAEFNIGNDYFGMKYKYLDVTVTNPENPAETNTYRMENGFIDAYWSYNDNCISFWYNEDSTINYFTRRGGEHSIPSNKIKAHIVGIPLGFDCVLTEINPPYGTIIDQSGRDCKWYLNSSSNFELKPSGDITVDHLVDKRNGGPGYIEFNVRNDPDGMFAPLLELIIDGHSYYVSYPRD